MKNTIVIADDETIPRMDICEILTENGYDVVGEASNGFDAVELCRKFKPDLAFMDIKMPLLDGLKATRIIIEEELAGSVVIFSAYSDTEFIEQAKACGVMGYMMKPIDEKNLIPQIEVAISKGIQIKKIKEDIVKAKEEIDKRKNIDMAKKILINKYNINENEAYKRIRSESMNRRCSIDRIAKEIIEGQIL